MAKLTDFKNPFSGNTEKLNFSTAWSYLLGSVFIIAIVAGAQNAARFISGKSGGRIDTTIEPLTTARPQIIENRKRYNANA